MDDLGKAMAGNSRMLMLGGGNPAHIPEVQALFRLSMDRLMAEPGRLERTLGNYDAPQGHLVFIEALAELLNDNLGWDIGPQNIATTNGSQMAFFILMNLFAGSGEDGVRRHILLPLTPEYIGYSDVGIDGELFSARKPNIEMLDNRLFKYRVDFDALDPSDETGAICVSRPTNPTGNVLTDDEIGRLQAIAKAHDVPFIIDSAYGMPFPSIMFAEANLTWDNNTIHCLSLSKLGLPSARTGIVVADEAIIRMVGEATAIMGLAPTNLGPAITLDMVKSGKIARLGPEIIQPFYREKAQRALEQFHSELNGVEYFIHKPEGALFLWLWFPDLPITSRELYERLKKRGCLVVSGHYFFPGLNEAWPHKNECIRVTYSQSEEVVTAGINIIAEEVKRVYNSAKTSA
jgi:valine--pyruvate aminotransferase